LWGLPRIDAAFEQGALSYSKVRALCRVATEKNETDLLAYALDRSAAQVENYCRRLRQGDVELSAQDAKRLHEARSLSRTFRDDGTGCLSVELPRAEIELVLQALEFVAGSLPDDPSRSLFAKGADALVEMARDALAGRAGSGSAPDTYQVVVHVDASALEGRGGEADLPLPTVRKLTCDGAIVPIVTDADGGALDVGRKQRTVPIPLKRALFARDRHCTFPGCHHTQYLDAHHVQHWADGGATSLDNLLVLCTTHHTLVHEGGFSIARHPDGRFYFVRPDGRPVEAPLVASAETRIAESHSAECVQGARPCYRVVRSGQPTRSNCEPASAAPVRTSANARPIRPVRTGTVVARSGS
jgi:hypothetical protein